MVSRLTVLKDLNKRSDSIRSLQSSGFLNSSFILKVSKKQTSVGIGSSSVVGIKAARTLFVQPICQLADKNTYSEGQGLGKLLSSRN